MFATIFFAVLNTANGVVRYVNAGHEPPLVSSRQGIKAMLKSSGPAAGLFSDYTYRAQTIRLEPGDTLIGFTDGVTEANSPTGMLFSKQRLRQLVGQPPVSAQLMMDRILEALKAHIGKAPQSDDITLLIVRRMG
jgi:serine phosphatase RsbU (regulator of sigma subunit)